MTRLAPGGSRLLPCAIRGCARVTRATVLTLTVEADRTRERVRCDCPDRRTWKRINVHGGRE